MPTGPEGIPAAARAACCRAGGADRATGEGARGRGRKRGTPGDPTMMDFFKEQAVREQPRQQAAAERLINILELLICEK